MVYSTDVIPEIAAQIRVFPFPLGVTPDILYPIAALKHAQDPTGARAFVGSSSAMGERF